eukprot:gnl/TRDRNA2_/TRDRNA2_192831_c0_seq1.p1 gnl/TRDRNA2_/TRDRNA2_192831_c0~~gnl/TRDRNA2_/TRDRNA2_192831_c0_seq1.p1  ORF type:complete len:560 (+),score=89.59 gnl/TRDRNA2_/TRDRNA2_192831_c0_seq1:42-1721(+)
MCVGSVMAMGASRHGSAGTSSFSEIMQGTTHTVLAQMHEGLLDVHQVHQQKQQNLMFFAAARPRKLGGAVAIAAKLKAQGVKADDVDDFLQTPIYYACREGNSECVRWLADAKCDVNARDRNGQTPLFYAAREGWTETCKVLFELGADVGVLDVAGQDAASYATPETKLQMSLQGLPLDRQHGNGASASRVHPEPRGRKTAVLQRRSSVRVAASAVGQRLSRRLSITSSDPREDGDDDDSLINGGETDDSVSAVGSSVILEEEEEDDRQLPTKKRRTMKILGADNGQRVLVLRQELEKWANFRGTEPRIPPVLPPRGEALASVSSPECGSYYVCRPMTTDAPRLREIEREFVLDHFELFSQERWTEMTLLADWCRAVNVIQSETTAVRAISQIVDGTSSQHTTLQCIHVPPPSATGERAEPPVIVGYVHFVHSHMSLDISHLKVVRDHRGRGIGALLLAGMAKHTEREGYLGSINDLRLVVMSRNKEAIKLYTSLGLKATEVLEKDMKQGLANIQWTRMVLSDAKTPQRLRMQQFVERCQKRASFAAEQQDRGDVRALT